MNKKERKSTFIKNKNNKTNNDKRGKMLKRIQIMIILLLELENHSKKMKIYLYIKI